MGKVSIDEFTGPRTPTVTNCGRVLPILGLTDQESLGSSGTCSAKEITAETGRHEEGKQELLEVCGSVRTGCLSSVLLRAGQLTKLLESAEWEELIRSCKQLPLLAFHINP